MSNQPLLNFCGSQLIRWAVLSLAGLIILLGASSKMVATVIEVSILSRPTHNPEYLVQNHSNLLKEYHFCGVTTCLTALTDKCGTLNRYLEQMSHITSYCHVCTDNHTHRSQAKIRKNNTLRSDTKQVSSGSIMLLCTDLCRYWDGGVATVIIPAKAT